MTHAGGRVPNHERAADPCRPHPHPPRQRHVLTRQPSLRYCDAGPARQPSNCQRPSRHLIHPSGMKDWGIRVAPLVGDVRGTGRRRKILRGLEQLQQTLLELLLRTRSNRTPSAFLRLRAALPRGVMSVEPAINTRGEQIVKRSENSVLPHHHQGNAKQTRRLNQLTRRACSSTGYQMDTVLMQRAAAGWCRRVGEAASLAGHGQLRPRVVRLGSARRVAGVAVRARLGPVRAHVSELRSAEAVVGEEEDAGAMSLFVGLPEDAVSCDGRAVTRPRAVSAALRALKLLGVDGVELPVSWAVAQPGSGDGFEWAGYLAIACMVRDAGLGLRVSLNTHGAALPGWVADAAAADPDIVFTDRAGNRREGCLSFAVDEVPVLAGQTPLEACEAFFRSFGDAFADFLGSTVTEVTVSLGPNGELRYPSYPPGSGGGPEDYAGVGEFQCYDKHMLARLKRHAESSGQPLWGLSGPHDAPRYDESPESSAFFKEAGGSWKTAYGHFFLSWYARELLAHGDRVLAAATRAFGDKPVQLSAKVPLLHGSPAAEATAGFYGGYGPFTEMFARHVCTLIASGVDARPDAAGSSPAEELLARIKNACAEHGTRLAVESAPLAVARDCDGFTGAWRALLSAERTRPCQFTYQRMGAEFFSPSHWPLFVQFVRALELSEEAHGDDMPGAIDGGERERLTVPSAGREAQGEAREMQTV